MIFLYRFDMGKFRQCFFEKEINCFWRYVYQAVSPRHKLLSNLVIIWYEQLFMNICHTPTQKKMSLGFMALLKIYCRVVDWSPLTKVVAGRVVASGVAGTMKFLEVYYNIYTLRKVSCTRNNLESCVYKLFRVLLLLIN